MICKISSNATNAPTMGVHRPGMRRSPNAGRNKEVSVVLIRGSLHSVEFARRSSEAPSTTRMRSNLFLATRQRMWNIDAAKPTLRHSTSFLLCRDGAKP
jgi:hypothetical protein